MKPELNYLLTAYNTAVIPAGCGTREANEARIEAVLAAYAAESAQSVDAVGEWVMVPRQIHVDADAFEALQFTVGSPEEGKFCDGTLWIGECEDDDGSKIHGLHLSCNECPEEGSITIATFPAYPPTVNERAVEIDPSALTAASNADELAQSRESAGVIHGVTNGIFKGVPTGEANMLNETMVAPNSHNTLPESGSDPDVREQGEPIGEDNGRHADSFAPAEASRKNASPPPAQTGAGVVALPIDSAPRDGTMVRILVQFEDYSLEDTTEPVWTIGANGLFGGDDHWCIAGWDWEQDCFTGGEGTPIGWLPFHATYSAPASAKAVCTTCNGQGSLVVDYGDPSDGRTAEHGPCPNCAPPQPAPSAPVEGDLIRREDVIELLDKLHRARMGSHHDMKLYVNAIPAASHPAPVAPVAREVTDEMVLIERVREIVETQRIGPVDIPGARYWQGNDDTCNAILAAIATPQVRA